MSIQETVKVGPETSSPETVPAVQQTCVRTSIDVSATCTSRGPSRVRLEYVNLLLAVPVSCRKSRLIHSSLTLYIPFWDAANRVTSVFITGGGTTSMQYDYTGTRVKKDAPTGITLYPFDGVEIAPNGVMTKFIRIGIETFASKKSTGQKRFYHNDHLGGVDIITDMNLGEAQRDEYDPWGTVSKSVGNDDPTHRFTGKELDPETGFYYYGGRYYDQEIGRFVSADPLVSSPDNPQSLNREEGGVGSGLHR